MASKGAVAVDKMCLSSDTDARTAVSLTVTMQHGPWLNCALPDGCTLSPIGMDMPSIPSQHGIERAVPSIAIARVHCIDAHTCGTSRSSVSRTETDWSARFINIVICIVAEAGFLVNCAISPGWGWGCAVALLQGTIRVWPGYYLLTH